MVLGKYIGNNPFKKRERKLQSAGPEDIIIGNEIIYKSTEYHPEFTATITDVLRPSDAWKAFCAEDGCRYGLDGAYIVEHEAFYLYKISQTINNDWDAIRSAIVCARDEDEASRIHPNKGTYHNGDVWIYGDINKMAEYAEHEWCHPLNVKVELIGIAEHHIEIGVV